MFKEGVDWKEMQGALEQYHQEFQQAVKDSEPAVSRMAIWFTDHGWKVRMPPLQIAKAHAEWRDYADKGDLFISKGILVDARIEIKHRPRFDFAADGSGWPFDNLIIIACHAFDEAKQKPFAIIHVNASMTAAGLVYGESWEHWRVWPDVPDYRRPGYTQACYVAEDLSLVRFFSLED